MEMEVAIGDIDRDQVPLFDGAMNEPLVCNAKAKEHRMSCPGFITILRLNDINLNR